MENNNQTDKPVDPIAFAQGLRTTYPGAFDSIKDDYALTRGFIDTHPEYASHVDFGPQQNPHEIIKEEGLVPQGPISSITGPLAGLLGKASEKVAQSEQGGGALAPLGIGLQMASQALPTSESEAAIQYLGGKALEGLGSAVKLPKSGKEAQTLAQSYKSLGAIPERITQSVLKRLEQGVNVLSDAKPVEEATVDYVKSIPGLKNVTESLHENLGKSVPTLGDYGKYLDDIVAKAKSPQGISGQEALDGIQATNKILSHKEFNKDKDIVKGLIERKNTLIDLLDQAYPDFKDANQALRDAHLKDEFSSFFPRNKNMSVNQLRGALTMAANVASGTASLMTGNPVPLASSLAVTTAQSPKVLGGLIRGRAFLGQDVSFPRLGGLVNKGGKAVFKVSPTKEIVPKTTK